MEQDVDKASQQPAKPPSQMSDVELNQSVWAILSFRDSSESDISIVNHYAELTSIINSCQEDRKAD